MRHNIYRQNDQEVYRVREAEPGTYCPCCTFDYDDDTPRAPYQDLCIYCAGLSRLCDLSDNALQSTMTSIQADPCDDNSIDKWKGQKYHWGVEKKKRRQHGQASTPKRKAAAPV